MAVPDFQRARSAAAKQQREAAILAAARALGPSAASGRSR